MSPTQYNTNIYVVYKPWLVGVYSEYTTQDRGQRKFAIILPEPKARAICGFCVAARAVPVRVCDLNGCCSVLSAIIWQRKRTKRREEENADYCWVVVVAHVFTNISSCNHQRYGECCSIRTKKPRSYIRCIRHTTPQWPVLFSELNHRCIYVTDRFATAGPI